jgi:adenine-specific DNA-methyltransferase
MQNKKQKLELTWIGKDKQPVLEPRILIEDPEKSYGDKTAENMLIYGDNLLALKALEQDFAGKIKCACIDPPYNTGNAFDHYDDGLEHSLWLSLIKPRIELLHKLLRNDGTLWICIDDDECHYLKVLCDEIFGRKNFVANVVWQKKFSPQNDAKWMSDMHDHILVYAKEKNSWHPNRIPIDSKTSKNRKNIDNDRRGEWISVDYTCNKNKYERPNLYYSIINPNTEEKIWPKETAVWRFSEERHLQNEKEMLVYWGMNGKNRVPRFKNFKAIKIEGQIPTTIWLHQDVGNNQDARKESIYFNNVDPFATPKPERLIQRILTLASNEGDWVLDSFLGSGTTDSVAHKMGRRWIGIELGEHCHTHCLPRLKKVVDGTDQGGISKAVNWKGGGGFKYYYLAPSLLKEDKYGNWIIDERYNADMLAAAMARHEGFRYSPDPEIYWKQGKSTEKDYIFTTTQFITVEFLDKIHDELRPDESLLICCKSFSKACDIRHANITVRKIPNMLLGRCEFGREDYSLNIINMPIDEDAPDFVPAGPTEAKKKPEKPNSKKQRGLFGKEDDK